MFIFIYIHIIDYIHTIPLCLVLGPFGLVPFGHHPERAPGAAAPAQNAGEFLGRSAASMVGSAPSGQSLDFVGFTQPYVKNNISCYLLSCIHYGGLHVVCCILGFQAVSQAFAGYQPCASLLCEFFSPMLFIVTAMLLDLMFSVLGGSQGVRTESRLPFC